MRSIARSLQISDGSVRNIVKNQLGYHPYKIAKAQFLNDRMKQNRLTKSRRLRRLAAAGRHKTVLFTDEKVFTIEQAHNHQNDRQLLPKGSLKGPNVKFVTRQHFPTSVMVWAGICATGKTPMIFVEKGVKINAKIYQESILRAVVDPWAQQHFGGEHWTFQQDWAPAHKANATRQLCKRLFPSIWDVDDWPSNSPDLNPLDYAVWSILEKKACATRHTSIETLKRDLQRAWDELSEETLTAICDNFLKRLDACIAAKGDHFEHLLK